MITAENVYLALLAITMTGSGAVWLIVRHRTKDELSEALNAWGVAEAALQRVIVNQGRSIRKLQFDTERVIDAQLHEINRLRSIVLTYHRQRLRITTEQQPTINTTR